MVTLSSVALAATVMGDVGTAKEQEVVGVAPAWVTVSDFPATVSFAVRATDEVFVAIEKVTVLLPAPLVPGVIVI